MKEQSNSTNQKLYRRKKPKLTSNGTIQNPRENKGKCSFFFDLLTVINRINPKKITAELLKKREETTDFSNAGTIGTEQNPNP